MSSKRSALSRKVAGRKKQRSDDTGGEGTEGEAMDDPMDVEDLAEDAAPEGEAPPPRASPAFVTPSGESGSDGAPPSGESGSGETPAARAFSDYVSAMRARSDDAPADRAAPPKKPRGLLAVKDVPPPQSPAELEEYIRKYSKTFLSTVIKAWVRGIYSSDQLPLDLKKRQKIITSKSVPSQLDHLRKLLSDGYRVPSARPPNGHATEVVITVDGAAPRRFASLSAAGRDAVVAAALSSLHCQSLMEVLSLMLAGRATTQTYSKANARVQVRRAQQSDKNLELVGLRQVAGNRRSDQEIREAEAAAAVADEAKKVALAEASAAADARCDVLRARAIWGDDVEFADASRFKAHPGVFS